MQPVGVKIHNCREEFGRLYSKLTYNGRERTRMAQVIESKGIGRPADQEHFLDEFQCIPRRPDVNTPKIISLVIHSTGSRSSVKKTDSCGWIGDL